MVIQRSKLYGKTDSIAEIKTINAELRILRKNIRMSNNIFADAERIQIRYNKALELEEEAERQNRYRNKNQIMR